MVNKRVKFTIQSLVLGLLVFLLSRYSAYTYIFATMLLLVVVVGNLFIHTENKPSLLENFYISLLPLHLVIGSVLTFLYFPSLSTIFKLIFASGIVFLNYVISLVNNIFLVVKSREEPIPLYRVALTWSKIVIIVLCIPFYAGLFKLPANTFIQSALTGNSAFLFSIYVVWSMRYESDAKKHGIGEAGYLSFIGAAYVLITNMAVSFIPTESFLRALFVASVLMFVLNYIYAHFKNAINKRLISEHTAISLFFLLLLLLFKP